MEIRSKSELGIILSKLKGFETGKVSLEQYQTDPEIAADILWNASFKDIAGKVIVDLGCGTGILGIGALLLDAKKVIFIDIDEKAIEILKENLSFIDEKTEKKLSERCEIICKDINDLSLIKADLVIQNPPFGVKKKHADKVFLEKAMEIAPIIYSLHKIESSKFIDKFSRDMDYKITHLWRFNFPLKQTMAFHKKRIERIEVGCWRLEKEKHI